MVWFQCEDCGENLKKPKLANHFRICSAYKLSCIDCGVVFGQDSVQGHTQCVTEAEKYGPKGQGKDVTTTKPKNNAKQKQKAEVDINVGLTERPPWFCSLCNSKATSKQALLLHADGKKHRAKARAFHAANEKPKTNEAIAPDNDITNENAPKSEDKLKDPLKADAVPNGSEAENLGRSTKKKRKLDASESNVARKKAAGEDNSGEFGGREVVHIEREEAKEGECHVPKVGKLAKQSPGKGEFGKKIKWKKLITSILNSNPKGVLKIKKLKKIVLKALQEYGVNEHDNKLVEVLEHKIHSTSRFMVNDNCVHLVAKD